MGVSVPLTLTDGAGFVWDVQTDGRIKDGSEDAFDGAFDNPDLRSTSTATLELDGRQVVLSSGPAISNTAIVLERRIFVPHDQPWARFIDTATNTSSAAIEYQFRLVSNYGADTLTQVVADTNGDLALTPDDHFFAIDDSNETGGDPFAGMRISDGTASPLEAGFSSIDISEITFEVTIAPGQSVSFLSFGAQSHSLVALTTALGPQINTSMTYGLSDGFADTIFNFDVEGYFEQDSYFGNHADDVLVGSPRDETFHSDAGDDVILADAGHDMIYAGSGDDVVDAGAGQDWVQGGAGADVVQGQSGADVLFGDGGGTLTDVALVTLPGGPDPLEFVLHSPEMTQSDTLTIHGAISSGALTYDSGNYVFVIDASASMLELYDGPDSVGDLNGDGVANQLIDMAIQEFSSLHHDLIDAGLGANEMSVIAMGDTAELMYSGALGGSLGQWHAITPDGGSNYEAALQKSIEQLSAFGAGPNHLLFMSDGMPSMGLSYADEAAQLRDPLGLDADIIAIPYGPSASVFDLDLMEDGVADLNVSVVTSRADLAAALRRPDFNISDIQAIELAVNGNTVASLDAGALEDAAGGYRFTAELSGLFELYDDEITATLVFDDERIAVSVVVLDETAARFDDTLSGGAGQDTLLGQLGADVLLGGDGNDTLDGGLGDDRLQGGAGDDVLVGRDGDDILSGGAGADILRGGTGQNTVSYAGSVHRVVVNLGNQSAFGGDADGDSLSGFFHVQGSAQDDAITGNYQDNILRGGLGDDWLFGRGGFDTADYSDAASGVAVSLKLPAGEQNTLGAGHDFLFDIEALIGSQFADLLVGDSSYNELTGGAGDDTLHSKGGNDRLDGGAGADRIYGNSGAERILGGAGNDVVNGYSGADTIFGGTGDDTLYGDNGGDSLFGHGGRDILRGGPGYDLLDGGRGADDLRGSRGYDVIYGGGGDDYIGGDEGNDQLYGQGGDDVLLGGIGQDVFHFSDGFGFDVIRDFEPGEDKLNLELLDLNDFQAFEALQSETGTGLRVAFGDGNVIFLQDLGLGDISVSDVVL